MYCLCVFLVWMLNKVSQIQVKWTNTWPTKKVNQKYSRSYIKVQLKGVQKKILSFLWQYSMKSLSCVQLFATPCIIAHQALPSMGFSREEYWSVLPFPSPGDLPDPESEPRSPTFQAHALPSELPGSHCSNVSISTQHWRNR